MRQYSIYEIEAAINYWRDKAPVDPKEQVLTLCEQARALANVYGQMIWERTESVARNDLSETQAAALEQAGN